MVVENLQRLKGKKKGKKGIKGWGEKKKEGKEWPREEGRR